MASILIVDDDARLARGIARFLELKGHETRTALDGREALEQLEAGPADLMITDVNMPELDGIALMMESGERWREIPVVAMSGGGRISKGELLSDARMLGADAVLEKPFSMDALLSVVDQLLADPNGSSE